MYDKILLSTKMSIFATNKTFSINLLFLRPRPAQENKQRPATDYPMAHDPVVAFCEGKYYLFTTGPYIDREGISLMEGGGTLVVEDYLFFHGYEITWDAEGWPSVQLH